MNRKSSFRVLPLLLLCAASAGFAQSTLVYTDDFDGLANGTSITTQNTNLSYVQSNGGIIEITDAGSSTPLLMQSAKAGNSTQGIGINLTNSSEIFTIAFNFKINELTGGTSFRFALGEAGASYYPASGALPSRLDQFPTAAWETFADQSAFILNMAGNGSTADSNFGKLGTLNSDGTAWTYGAKNFLQGTEYNLRFVANGSDNDITLNSDIILAGYVAVYVDDVLTMTLAMADNVTPDSFRIYTHGRSSGGGWNASAQIGDINIWDGAIPEPANAAFALGLACLLSVVIIRRKQ